MSLQSAPVSFWDYREHFKGLMTQEGAGVAAAEKAQAYEADRGPVPLDERLVQTIWAQQLVQGNALRLVDGRMLRVLEPGRWNGCAGPDFLGARLMIDGEAVQGDVEIHIKAGDWLAHGHQRDLAYNTVVLHVVLGNEGGGEHDTLHNGQRVPRLELEPYIFPDLETLRRSLSPDDYEYMQPDGVGRCHRLMVQHDSAAVAHYLDLAGRERLVAKMQRLDEQAAQASLDQVFYQAMMMALGTGPGKTLYYLLAKRTPLNEVREYVCERPREQWALTIEALLIHVAGLAPSAEQLEQAPAESAQRAEQLRALWNELEPYWSDRVIAPTRRWFQGIRPVNFPTRRLAAVAILLARGLEKGTWPLEELIAMIRQGAASLEVAPAAQGKKPKKHRLLTALTEWLQVPGQGHFWGTHYSFAARPAARTMNLIGEGTALSLVLNALLPAAVLVARRQGDPELEQAATTLFGLVPPLQANHITEFMTRRLFGADERSGRLITSEQRRQALFQIFYHCCNRSMPDCSQCYYFR